MFSTLPTGPILIIKFSHSRRNTNYRIGARNLKNNSLKGPKNHPNTEDMSQDFKLIYQFQHAKYTKIRCKNLTFDEFVYHSIDYL
jgi:predicted nucleic-acid-binding Zn-ribbon protein